MSLFLGSYITAQPWPYMLRIPAECELAAPFSTLAAVFDDYAIEITCGTFLGMMIGSGLCAIYVSVNDYYSKKRSSDETDIFASAFDAPGNLWKR